MPSKPKPPLRVAIAQIKVTGDPEINLARMERFARKAAARNAHVVLFSECCLSGYDWGLHGDPLGPAMDTQVKNGIAHLRALARELNLWIIFGTVRRNKGHWYNSTLALRPDGRIAAIYDKLHLVYASPEGTQAKPGNRLPTFRISGTPCAMLVCLDTRYPEPFRYLKGKGVKIVFLSYYAAARSARYKLPVLEGTLRCRAAENGFFVIASNCAGPGQSLVSRACDPLGISLGSAKLDREGIFVVEIDPTRTNAGFYNSRRTDLFGSKTPLP